MSPPPDRHPSLEAIRAALPRLADPAAAPAAAAAIDKSYRRLWDEVEEIATVASLRAALLARNALYSGDAVASIYRLLRSAPALAAAADAATAEHLLSILSALFTDVPAAFAAEGWADRIDEAMHGDTLIVPDTAELNALRCAPAFVSLALSSLLARPAGASHEPHVCVGYLNDIVGTDSVDAITSIALHKLLDDGGLREVLWRGVACGDPPKAFKCLQLLKRCVGGGPGMLAALAGPSRLGPPWNLPQLLELGAGAPLAAACGNVAAALRRQRLCDAGAGDRDRDSDRQLLWLLHTTLFDIFDLLAGADEPSSGSSSATASPRGSGEPAGRGTAASAAEAAAGAWPAALLRAHAALVVEVAQCVPSLVTAPCRMQPYAHSHAAAAALEELGAVQCMSALVGALAAADPTDWISLEHLAAGYQVVDTLCRHSPALALAALEAGGAGAVASALEDWAPFLCIPGGDASPTGDPGGLEPPVEPPGEQQHGLVGGGVGEEEPPAAGSPRGQEDFVDPEVAEAAAAALQLLRTLLAAAVSGGGVSSSSGGGTGSSRPEPSGSRAHPELEQQQQRAAGAAAPGLLGVDKGLCSMLAHLASADRRGAPSQQLRPLAADCVGHLRELGLGAADRAAPLPLHRQPDKPPEALAGEGVRRGFVGLQLR